MSVTIPFVPTYRGAFSAWLSYVWRFSRRPLFWLLTLIGVQALMMWAGYRAWQVWLAALLLTVAAILGLLPLLVGMLWVYRYRTLGVSELTIGGEGISLHGREIHLRAPWTPFEAFLEARHFFLLRRPDGLFSSIPKSDLPAETLAEVRDLLRSHLPEVARSRGSRAPEVVPHLSAWAYWSLYLLLVSAFVAAGLRLVDLSIWAPLGGMFVLNWLLTRSTLAQYLFAGFLMLAILVFGVIQVTTPREEYLQFKYRLLEVAAFLASFAVHQIVLWRVVLAADEG